MENIEKLKGLIAKELFSGISEIIFVLEEKIYDVSRGIMMSSEKKIKEKKRLADWT